MTQLINTMNKVMLHKYRLLAIGLALACLSCSKEQLSHDSQIATGNPVEMRLTVDAPMFSSVSNNETDINRLRVVVFGSTTAPDAGKLIMNKFYATAPAGDSFKEIITSGKRDIYIIVNEPLSGGGAELDSYKNIASVGDIDNLSLIYGGAGAAPVYAPSEIPMFVRHLDKQILIDSPNEISGAVERVMAKVSMKLNVKNSNFPSGKQVVVDNITIKNLPESSSWIATDYVGTFVDSEKQYIQAVTPVSGYDASSNNTFYVPEYIMANPDKGAYIEIKGHPNGEPSRINTWKVKLGDAMDDAGSYGDKYNITRNRHYTFTGDVKSYGDMSDLAVKVTVLPWNTVNMDEEVGRFVAFSKVTNATGVVIADGSNLSAMGEAIKVSCNTNIGGWYVVVRNAKGDVIHTSAPTAAVTSSTEQTVDVVMPPESNENANYSVSIYHPIVANESVGPVKSLSFIQLGGFIPNSVLIAAGWPVDRLPIEGGLQVAAIGNVLPGGTPAADDPKMQWSTEEIVTSITETGLGKGKGNYAQLATLDAVKYPIGQACKHLGAEWYVPSKDELRLIYDNRSLFGASYAFNANNYWSATEYGSTTSWDVPFSNGGTGGNYYKTSTDRVRCVKGTPALPPPPPTDSYIPTSVLIAAGWPVDRLPATGLQVAMRGNVLPGGTPAADDPTMKWKTSTTSSLGVELAANESNAKLGMGKSSTDAMTTASQKGLHPAAAHCRAMGPEWYLPSLAELNLIYTNKSLLGASYAFNASSYWSATENDTRLSWSVDLTYSGANNDTKGTPLGVRCVREI